MTADPHPTDTALAAYAAGEPADRGGLSDHIALCDQCRAIVVRLSDELLDELPDLPLAAVAPAVPPATVEAVADARTVEVAPDQLWRAAPPAGGPTQLLWTRRLRSDGRVAVVPVTFDTDHADEYSLIVPADRSPLGVDLVFHTTVETTIDRRTLLDCIVEHAGVAADIRTVRDARAQGLPVHGLRVGSPIVSLADERIEYRQQLSDALIQLTTAHFEPDRSDDDDTHDLPTDLPNDTAIGALIDDEITVELIETMLNGLSDTYPAARVLPARPGQGHASDISAFATIVNIDVFVSIVTVATDVPDDDLPELSRSVFHTDLSVQAVCFVTIPGSFYARLVDRRALSDAYETPSGRLRLPDDILHGPVADVLLKFFDRRVNPFRAITTATVDPITINQRDLAVQYGTGAVRDIAERAPALRVPGKADGYSRVTNHRDAVIRIVEHALTHDSVDIAAILEDEL